MCVVYLSLTFLQGRAMIAKKSNAKDSSEVHQRGYTYNQKRIGSERVHALFIDCLHLSFSQCKLPIIISSGG